MMTPRSAVVRVLEDGKEHSMADVTRGIKFHAEGTYKEAQKALFDMVKSKEVGWNRVMGRGGRYRLLSSANATVTAPPGAGGSGASKPNEPLGESEAWEAVDSAGRRISKLGDEELRWLADHGFLMLNRKGRDWYEGIESGE
jgi:hypothetical protein